VAAPATERERNRQAAAPATSATNSLLVIETHGRHVRHHDGEQRADVHASFHCGRHAQEIDGIGALNLVRRRQTYVLEEPLALATVALVRLPCEFFAVKSK
jgi:hypothetical protein